MQFFRYSLVYLSLFYSSKIISSDSEATISSPNSNSIDSWQRIENSSPTWARTDLRIESNDEWEELNIPSSDSVLSDCTDCSSSPQSACQSALSTTTIQPPFVETSVTSDVTPTQSTTTQQILKNYIATAEPAQSSPIIAPKLTQDELDQKLIQAVKEKKSQEVKELLAAGVNISYCPRGFLLRAAARIGDEETMQVLINAGLNVNETRENGIGITPILFAVSFNYSKIVKMLLDAGANTNVPSVFRGDTTLLHLAAYNGDKETIKVLIDAGLNVNATREDGLTSIEIATRRNYPEIVKTLLDAGANKNTIVEGYGTLLHFASYFGYEEVLKVLLNAGVNVHQVGERNMTALAWANGGVYAKKRTKIFKMLLDAGANKDQDFGAPTGGTILHAAAVVNNAEIVQLLLDAGADATKKDTYALTAQELAASLQCKEVLKVFEDYNKK